ncbi:MAG: PorV/PorQ family protein [bacterium]
MKKRSLYLCVAFLMLLCNGSFGQQSELNQVGTSMANFLKIGVGARATAMGDAFVALSDDISALYWNPGGLGILNKNEILFQVTDWLLDSRLYFFGLSFRLRGLGTLGISIYSFSSGDISETTVFEPDGTGRTFSASNFAAGLTYSRKITDRFSAGLTLKYVSEHLDREKASTIAIDVGSVFDTGFLNNLRIGFALSNLGGRMQLEGAGLNVQILPEESTKYTRAQLGTEPWDIPLLFRFGLATDIIRNEGFRLTVASEVMDSRDFIHRIATGGELAFGEKIFLRGGYRLNTDEADLTFGAGLNLTIPKNLAMKLDYAYSDYGVMDKTQRFSIIFIF